MMGSRRVRLGLFIFFQGLYALTSSGNAFRVPDEFEVYYQVEHLVDAGDLSVPQAVASGRFFGRIGVDGKPYAPYGPLAAIISVPHHLAARGVAAIAGLPRENISWTFVVSGLTMLSSSTAAALAVVGFHRAATTLGASAPAALLLSLLLGGASVLWTYGATFYSEAWQAAALIWAAALLLERRVMLSSALITLTVMVKFTSLVFVPGFIVAVMLEHMTPVDRRVRAAAALCGAAVFALAMHLAWNHYRFGQAMEFGYDWGETMPVPPARPFLLGDLPRGLAVLLFSPGKSLFLWAPVLLLSLTRLRSSPRFLAVGAAVSAIAGLIFYGAYLFPDGGYAHGPRHLVPLIPLLLLPAAASSRCWPRTAVAACFAVGFVVSALSVSVSFLQDQSLGASLDTVGYYERINPPPGRVWNRYNLEYVPFARTLASSNWPTSRAVGAGVDFFALHLMRARAAIPAAAAIPAWLPFALLATYGGILIAGGVLLTLVARQFLVTWS